MLCTLGQTTINAITHRRQRRCVDLHRLREHRVHFAIATTMMQILLSGIFESYFINISMSIGVLCVLQWRRWIKLRFGCKHKRRENRAKERTQEWKCCSMAGATSISPRIFSHSSSVCFIICAIILLPFNICLFDLLCFCQTCSATLSSRHTHTHTHIKRVKNNIRQA